MVGIVCFTISINWGNLLVYNIKMIVNSLKSFIQNIWILIFDNLNRSLSIVSYLIVFVSNPCNFHRLSLIQQQSLG